MAWLLFLMCSLEETKMTELIKLYVLVKVTIEQGKRAMVGKKGKGRSPRKEKQNT